MKINNINYIGLLLIAVSADAADPPRCVWSMHWGSWIPVFLDFPLIRAYAAAKIDYGGSRGGAGTMAVRLETVNRNGVRPILENWLNRK